MSLVLALCVALVLVAGLVPLEPAPLKYHVWTLGLSLATLVALALGQAGRPAARLLRPGLLLLAWAAFGVVLASYRHPAIEALLWLLALTGVGLVACRLGAGRERSLAAALALAGAVSGMWALLQALDLVDHAHWSNPVRNSGPYPNSNIFAAHLNVAALSAAGLTLAPGGALARILGLACLAPTVLALALTGSRGGWLAAAGGLAVLLAALAASRSRKRLVLGLGAVALVGLAVLSLGWRLGLFSGVAERLHGSGSYSLGHRAAIWRDTLALIAAEPLGTGIGTYETAFPPYRSFSDRFRVNSAHSEPLELGATLGWPGLALAAWLALAAAATAWSRARSSVLAAAFAAGLAALALHSLYDFPARAVTVGLEAALLAGLVLGAGSEARIGGRARWAAAPLALAVAGVAAIYGLSERTADQALRAEGALRLNQALELYQRAARLAPTNAELARALGGSYLRRAQVATAREVMLERAHGELQRAVALNPRELGAHLGLALIARTRGDTALAFEHYRAAIACEPSYASVYAYAGEYAIELGDERRALELMGASLGLFPRWGLNQRFARMARAEGLDDAALARLVPARSEALVIAVPQLLEEGYGAAASQLLARHRGLLAEADYVAMLEALARRKQTAAARPLLAEAKARWPGSDGLARLERRLHKQAAARAGAGER